MTPEQAIVGFLVTGILTIGAIVALLPKFLEAKIEDYRKDEEAKRQHEAESFKVKLEEVNSRTSITISMASNLEVLTKALMSTIERIDNIEKTVRANTEQITSLVTTVGDVEENFGLLLKDGSKPLQAIARGLSELTQTAVSIQQDTKQLENVLLEVGQMKITLEIIQKVVESKIEEVKHQTGEVQTVQPPKSDDAKEGQEGKPAA